MSIRPVLHHPAPLLSLLFLSFLSLQLDISCLGAMAAGGSGSGFANLFDVTWGDGRAKVLDNGRALSLSLDKASGSGFQSKNDYLFGRFDAQIKLVPGNSAGTVTTYYVSSQGPKHDEIDLEFLGNQSGDPYTLHTNVFANGVGNKEEQFHLWFDPTSDFHTYSIIWTSQHIIFMVDGTPIRDFKNHMSKGIPFPTSQPMKVYGSLWDAEDWATQGGRVKTNWNLAPFTASYRGFTVNACPQQQGSCSSWDESAVVNQAMGSTTTANQGKMTMESVRSKYMVYSYCKDAKRFPQGLPAECSLS